MYLNFISIFNNRAKGKAIQAYKKNKHKHIIQFPDSFYLTLLLKLSFRIFGVAKYICAMGNENFFLFYSLQIRGFLMQ